MQRLTIILLPIVEFLPVIARQLATANRLILQAEPGAGKSTALPLSLLDAPWLKGKKILMLEPRRVAAKSIAHYLAQQLGEQVGKRVGYQIKNERKLSSATVLEIVTEGILTRRLQNDPQINDIGLIIFDEFHERSLHADLALLLVLEIQQTIRDDLKLLLMSATIDTALISTYMGGAAVIDCPGRAFPVTVDYVSDSKQPLTHRVTSALRTLLDPPTPTPGDILVFLPGQADIHRCMAAAKTSLSTEPNLLMLPLYGGLSLAQQEQALLPDAQGKQRIVFTTNIAETSLTIDGVTAVIDSGLEKVLTYDPTSGMSRLETTYISKASAEQRTGRAGRTQAGHCIRLWSQHRHNSLRDYQGEEILSADLSATVLELLLWSTDDYDAINWLTPPPRAHFNTALATLVSLGLIDADNKVTPQGKAAATIGLPPRLAALLLQAAQGTEQAIACELAALLADRDIFHPNKDVDIVTRLMALQDYKANRNAAFKNYPIQRSSIELLLKNAGALKKRLKISAITAIYSLTQLQNTVGKLLLYAYPDRLAKQRSHGEGRYLLANGKGVFLFDDDPLFGSEWLVIADCDGQKTEGRIYSAAAVSYKTIVGNLAHKFQQRDQFDFDQSKQKISGQSVTHYGAIKIKSTTIATIPADKFQQCLLQIIQHSGLDILNWTDQCEQWLARAQWLGEQLNDFPLISKTALQATIDTWLLPYLSKVNSIAALKKINVLELLLGSLSWEQQQLLNRHAPSSYTTPGNKNIPIVYDRQQGPTVSVQLQEMFGEIHSPKIGGGKVAIRFELLSPARRPIQTTSDLEHFWKNSYFEVAKEMRGRYPKHRWPDQPLLEKAGKSIKNKR